MPWSQIGPKSEVNFQLSSAIFAPILQTELEDHDQIYGVPVNELIVILRFYG